MRKIEFRAKAKNKNAGVYGDLIHDENSYSILSKKEGCLKIKPNTIGQYTGINIKKGNFVFKIFEGDILKDNKGQFGKVFYSEYQGAFLVNWKMKDGSYETDSCFRYDIVGNIYDNPELLEGE